MPELLLCSCYVQLAPEVNDALALSCTQEVLQWITTQSGEKWMVTLGEEIIYDNNCHLPSATDLYIES